MLDFVLTQMNNANTQSCNKFDSSMIFIIKNIIGGWPDKFQDTVFKSTKASNISNVMVKIVPLGNSWGKKRIFEKVMFCFEKGVCFKYFSWRKGIVLTLSWRRPLSYRNQSIDLLCKSMDWFLYDNGLRHDRVKGTNLKRNWGASCL